MKRTYIYIIVFLLTIIISVSDYYVDLSLNAGDTTELENLEATNNLAPNLFDDTEEERPDALYSAELKTQLTVTNYQNDDEKLNYTYYLRIETIYGTHKYKKGDKEGYLVFSANGETLFELSSNESITIYDVPNDVEYTIEQRTKALDKYTTKINDALTQKAYGTVRGLTNIVVENNIVTPYEKPGVNKPEENKPEENKPTEEKPVENKNPVTGDNFYFLLILLATTIGFLFTLAKIKVRRFE